MDKEEKKAGKAQTHISSEEFKGYTLDELKYQRALVLLKREFLKEKAFEDINQVKNRIPILNGKSPMDSVSPGGIVGKLVRGLSYADYLILGFSVFNAGKKVLSLFSRKRR